MFVMSLELFCDQLISLNRCGSIDANYNLRFATVQPPATQELTQALQTSLETDGGLVLDDGRTFTVDMTSVVFEGTS